MSVLSAMEENISHSAAEHRASTSPPGPEVEVVWQLQNSAAFLMSAAQALRPGGHLLLAEQLPPDELDRLVVVSADSTYREEATDPNGCPELLTDSTFPEVSTTQSFFHSDHEGNEFAQA